MKTSDRRIAIPRALTLAAEAKRLFLEARTQMARGRDDDGFQVDFGLELGLDELGMPKLKITDAKPEDSSAVNAAIATTFEGFARLQQGAPIAASAPTPAQPATHFQPQTAPDKSPLLSQLIGEFLKNESERGIKPTMKKHNAVLPMYLEFVGDRPASQLLQKPHVTDFLEMVLRLPPHWTYLRDKTGRPAHDIAKQGHPKTMAQATFTGTYRNSLKLFLDWAATNYQDQGFPTTLATNNVKYKGTRRKATQQKQRAFTLDELKRLFEGPEMAALAADPTLPGRFWLPHLLLFAGSRINETCQVNPQTDIIKDPTGIWFIRITEDEADNDESDEKTVEKSVKTGVTREVPIHRALISLGFIDYVERVKTCGARTLFPEWEPRNGRAGVNAERWFIRFLHKIGLHGVKNEKGRAIRGAHAFRHNLLTYGRKQGLNLRPISGHVEKSDNEVADGYEDDTIIAPLEDKHHRLDQLEFGLTFHRPVATTWTPNRRRPRTR